ncbi:MAG: YIP1 family protein [Candidatus Micrarchaeia archaeon]|jgi:hypothetical protein
MARKEKSSAAAAAPQKSAEGWAGKAYGIAGKFEQLVARAASPLPSPRIKLWLAGFFHPGETYDKVEKGATLAGVAANLIIFYFAYFLVFFLFMLALTSSLSAEDMAEMGLRQNPDILQIALVSLLIDPLVSTFLAMAQFALVFIAARLVGGKGTYAKQANSMSLVLCGSSTLLLAFVCAAFVIFIPAFALRHSAFIGTVVSIMTALVNAPILLLCFAIFLYSVYAHYAVVKRAHGLSPWRAAGAIAIAAGFIALLYIALGAMMPG